MNKIPISHRLERFALRLNKDNKNYILTPGTYLSNPRFNLYIFDKEGKMLEARTSAMDLVHFKLFIELSLSILNKNRKASVKIQCKERKRKEDGTNDENFEIVEGTYLIFENKKEGAYIKILKKNAEDIDFKFNLSLWHEIEISDMDLDDSIKSRMLAKSYFTSLYEVLNNIASNYMYEVNSVKEESLEDVKNKFKKK